MKCTLSPEAGVICFLTEALTGWKRLVYLKRHHADLTRDSCFFLRTHSLGTMLSATRLFCRTVFGCWRRLFADIITARESAELIPLQFSAARRHAASRWRALLSTHTQSSARWMDPIYEYIYSTVILMCLYFTPLHFRGKYLTFYFTKFI